jgi:hypothetical protein
MIDPYHVAFGVLYSHLARLTGTMDEYNNTIAWVNSPATSIWSFRWCCAQLNLQPQEARIMLSTITPAKLRSVLNQYEVQMQLTQEVTDDGEAKDSIVGY